MRFFPEPMARGHVVEIRHDVDDDRSPAPSASARAGAISPGRSTRIPRTPKLLATAVKSVGPNRISSSPLPGRLPATRRTPVRFWPKPELLLTTTVTAMPQRRRAG